MVLNGTGVLDVWCPASVARFHALAAADYVEFEVTAGIAPAESQPPPRPESKAPPKHGAQSLRLAFVDWLHPTAP